MSLLKMYQTNLTLFTFMKLFLERQNVKMQQKLYILFLQGCRQDFSCSPLGPEKDVNQEQTNQLDRFNSQLTTLIKVQWLLGYSYPQDNNGESYYNGNNDGIYSSLLHLTFLSIIWIKCLIIKCVVTHRFKRQRLKTIFKLSQILKHFG